MTSLTVTIAWTSGSAIKGSTADKSFYFFVVGSANQLPDLSIGLPSLLVLGIHE
jgi:hypothetical protein